MGTDVFLLTKTAGSNSIQRACSQASPLIAGQLGRYAKILCSIQSRSQSMPVRGLCSGMTFFPK